MDWMCFELASCLWGSEAAELRLELVAVFHWLYLTTCIITFSVTHVTHKILLSKMKKLLPRDVQLAFVYFSTSNSEIWRLNSEARAF